MIIVEGEGRNIHFSKVQKMEDLPDGVSISIVLKDETDIDGLISLLNQVASNQYHAGAKEGFDIGKNWHKNS